MMTLFDDEQTAIIQTQIDGLNKAKSMCERMLETGVYYLWGSLVIWWRACQRMLIKLYVFCYSISRIIYYTVCPWGTKKYSGCFVCRYSCTYWAIDYWYN